MYYVPALLIFSLAPETGLSAKGRDGDFVIEVRVLEVAAGTPVTMEVTLTYTGKKQITFEQNSRFSNVAVTTPPNWKRNERILFVSGSWNGYETVKMKSGEKRREIIPVYPERTGTKAGKTQFLVEWPIADLDVDFENFWRLTIPNPRTVLEVNIPPVR